MADGLTDAPPDAVAHHGFAKRAGHGKADARTIGLRLTEAKSRKRGAGDAQALVVDSSKILGSQQAYTFWKTSDADYLSSLTVSLWRPRARRREITARPFLVAMRERTP